MAAAQSRQKAYADNRRRPLEFEVGDKVFLKVSPKKGVRRTGSKNKLAPRYVGPFEILDRIGPVAYRLALPPALERMHNVFHVSQLRKYVPDPNHIISYGPLQIQEDMSYTEEPVQIHIEEATWELEEEIRKDYPQLFQGTLSFEDETSIRRVECNTCLNKHFFPNILML